MKKFNYKGNELFRQNKLEEAIEEYSKGIKLNLRNYNHKIYANRSAVYIVQK